MGRIYYCEHCDYDAKGRPSNYYRHLRTLKHQKAVKRTEELTEKDSISDDSIDESLDKIIDEAKKRELITNEEKDSLEYEEIPTKNSCFLPFINKWFNCKPIQVST